MTATHWIQKTGAACALMTAFLPASMSFGEVIAEPSSVTFTSPKQSATITLTNGGAPVAAGEIRGWQLLASDHDYKHMIVVEKIEGGLKIAPSATVEVGSYLLNIDTAQGPVVVHVFTPLSDSPDAIDRMMTLTGLSEKKVMESMGLTTVVGRERIQLDLPAVYYEGQTLEIAFPRPAAVGRTSSWFINGERVASGKNVYALSYTFETLGEYIVTYVETEIVDGALVTIASATAHTFVVPMPGVPTEVSINTETEFAPPLGYQKLAWRIDGVDVQGGPTLKHTFQNPGNYVVECYATIPDQTSSQSAMRVRYNIIATRN